MDSNALIWYCKDGKKQQSGITMQIRRAQIEDANILAEMVAQLMSELRGQPYKEENFRDISAALLARSDYLAARYSGKTLGRPI